jgi:hypothetical protein
VRFPPPLLKFAYKEQESNLKANGVKAMELIKIGDVTTPIPTV